ncbi:MAG: hypothetical protein NTW87_37090 [Planctomycetota bacterium]|nr:hypothetical protein [Planctomycetota bacterium]
MFEQPFRRFDIEGVWSGHYAYRTFFGLTIQQPVKFTAVFKNEGGMLGGQIYEPNTFGRREAEHLEADIVDLSVGEDGTVRFTKKYTGMGGAWHKVEYQGCVSQDGSTISGRWRMSWLGSGSFEIQRENLPEN